MLMPESDRIVDRDPHHGRFAQSSIFRNAEESRIETSAWPT
jgi:hypothetical protein